MQYLVEKCGAQWAAYATQAARTERAFWVQLVHGQSQARPAIVGFYTDSINTACEVLGIIPIGDAIELPVQRIMVTSSTFARASAAAALATGATIATAHPGHDSAPVMHSHEPAAVIWCSAAIACACWAAAFRSVYRHVNAKGGAQ